MFDRFSLEIAAAKHGVSYATARRWKADSLAQGDDWDKAQAAQLIAGGGIEGAARQMLAGLVTQYQATMDELDGAEMKPADKVALLASLADAYNKTINASKRILPETNELAIAMGVVQRLAAFIKDRHPEHVGAFADVLGPFGDELAIAYG
ncbi:DNA-binding protein [Burkholderia humptydooensis MSMB43]|uniref:DNA-binding protein n=1 Tax=Burkholderia humptydooensis MSMB43 TaxID=441157 RepID=A0ABN0G8N4_9BURK|nr:DNA-binding protein [Burkholderia humptydooensis MSMB43]